MTDLKNIRNKRIVKPFFITMFLVLFIIFIINYLVKVKLDGLLFFIFLFTKLKLEILTKEINVLEIILICFELTL